MQTIEAEIFGILYLFGIVLLFTFPIIGIAFLGLLILSIFIPASWFVKSNKKN
jgi:hypothetical protein